MYGMGNWAEVGEHVGTKTKEACVDHFKDAYLESPYFPLPVRNLSEIFCKFNSFDSPFHLHFYFSVSRI